jgi:hypothetical protein
VDAENSMFFAGLIVGGLWGIILMIVLRWAAGALRRARSRRRQRRASRALKREPLPQLWATGAGHSAAGAAGSARRAPGSIDDYKEGRRTRPTFNPDSGPRDW